MMGKHFTEISNQELTVFELTVSDLYSKRRISMLHSLIENTTKAILISLELEDYVVKLQVFIEWNQ